MKKTISIILTLCMVLGICSFSVAAAPEGTAITDAAGFAAMDPAGNYYLANDIIVEASYAQTFTGTLDGNGNTINMALNAASERNPFPYVYGKIMNLGTTGTLTNTGANYTVYTLTAADGLSANTYKITIN